MPTIELVDMCSTSSIACTDLTYTVVCPSGTKADRSITRSNLMKGTSAFTTLGAQTADLNMSTQKIVNVSNIDFQCVGQFFCCCGTLTTPSITTSGGIFCPAFGTDISINVCGCSAVHFKAGANSDIIITGDVTGGILDLNGARIECTRLITFCGGCGAISSNANDLRVFAAIGGTLRLRGLVSSLCSIDLNGNCLIGCSTTQTIVADAGGWTSKVPACDIHEWQVAGNIRHIINTNGPQAPSFTDCSRPNPACVTAGTYIFNTTDAGLNISDGTNWRAPSGGWVNT